MTAHDKQDAAKPSKSTKPDQSSYTPSLTPEGFRSMLQAFVEAKIITAAERLSAADDGTGSYTITVNKNWVQCDQCKTAFQNAAVRRKHYEKYSSGCREHSGCFSHAHDTKHAEKHRHSRCFVPGCKDKFAERKGWPEADVKEHILKTHGVKKTG